MPSKVWDLIIYPFPNFNGCTVEVWEWISNFSPHFIMDEITYRGPSVQVGVMGYQCAGRSDGVPVCTLGPHYSYLHTGTPLLLPAHWDPITPTCKLRPHYSYLQTGTPLLLPAHWDPITPTCTLRSHYSYLHTGTLLLPAHWDPINPTYTLGPYYSYLHTGTSWYSCLHI